ncbi:MAG: hypothetical protein OHK0038_03390 [Flammeovirgaceae bacterium]
MVIGSCDDDNDPVVSDATIQLPTLSADAANKTFVFNIADSLKSLNTVISNTNITWTAANFSNVSLPVKYSLQMDSMGRNFSKAVTLYAGSATSFDLKTTDPLVKNFDAKLIALGLPFGENSKVELRVKVEVLSDAGNAVYPVKYSNTISFTVNPYLVIPPRVYETIGFIGSAVPVTGWDSDVDMHNPTLIEVRKWVLTIDLIPGACKFRANDGWAINWGGRDFPSGVAEFGGIGNDIPIPEAGKYKIEFNDETLQYRFTKLE